MSLCLDGGGALPALQFCGKQAIQHHIRVKGLIGDSFLADMDKRTLHRWLDVREHFYVRNKRLYKNNMGMIGGGR